MRCSLALVVVALVASSVPLSAQQMEAHAPEVQYLGGEGPGPFSDAVRVGHMLYLSGKIGTLPSGDLIEGGVQAQTRQTMENIKASLERWGSSLDRVVKCSVMMDDIGQWGAMNEVYRQYFPDHKPARSAFGADGLALGAALEIECWATVGG